MANYSTFEQYKKAADISKRISALRVSNETAYRTEVNSIKGMYDLLTIDKELVKNTADLNIAIANIASAEKIEELIVAIASASAPDKVKAIKDARTAYDVPPATTGTAINVANVKKIVNNLAELTKWEKVYNASLSVDKLIDSIDPKASSFESKTFAAQSAFDKLAVEEQVFVQKVIA